MGAAMATFTLTGPDGQACSSDTPGTLGGHRRLKIYGRLDCPSANRHLARGAYAAHRVFFADEAAAIGAGYRPCANCMPERHATWKAGGEPGSAAYPWCRTPG